MKVSQSIAAILKIVIVIATIIYLLFLVDKLFLERMIGRMLIRGYDYNVIPFKTISTYIREYHDYNFNTWFDNLFGNVLLFIPFGFILPYFSTRYRRVGPFSLFTISLIFVLEVLQLLLHVGSFDIDDIILNSAGAFIGFYTFSACRKALSPIVIA